MRARLRILTTTFTLTSLVITVRSHGGAICNCTMPGMLHLCLTFKTSSLQNVDMDLWACRLFTDVFARLLHLLFHVNQGQWWISNANNRPPRNIDILTKWFCFFYTVQTCRLKNKSGFSRNERRQLKFNYERKVVEFNTDIIAVISIPWEIYWSYYRIVVINAHVKIIFLRMDIFDRRLVITECQLLLRMK